MSIMAKLWDKVKEATQKFVDKVTGKEESKPTSSTPQYQGPVQQGTSESVFRETGKSVSTTTSSSGGGGGSGGGIPTSGGGGGSGGGIPTSGGSGRTDPMPMKYGEPDKPLSHGEIYQQLKDYDHIKVTTSGGVQVYNPKTGTYDRTLAGNAVVPGTGGKTANQLQWELKSQGVKSGSSYHVSGGSTYNISPSKTSSESSTSNQQGLTVGIGSSKKIDTSNLNIPAQTDWDKLGGTRNFLLEEQKAREQARETIESQREKGKIGDLWKSALGGLGAGIVLSETSLKNVPMVTGGVTGEKLVTDYREKKHEIETEHYKGLFTPFQPIKTAKDYYNLLRETRGKVTDLQLGLYDVQQPENIYSPEKQQSILGKAGFHISDIKIKKDTKTWDVNETLPSGEIKTTTYTETTKGLETPEFKVTDLGTARLKYLADTDRKGQAYFELGTGVTSNILETGLKGSLASMIPVWGGQALLGGASTEGGLVGQGVQTIAGAMPKVGKTMEFFSKPAVLLAGVGMTGVEGATGVGSSTIKTILTGDKFELGGGYKLGEETGLNKWVTSLAGAGEEVGKLYAFTAGATQGEVSPVKVTKVQTVSPTGDAKTLSTLHIGEPFSGKYTALGSKFGGKVSLGYTPLKDLKGYNILDTTSNQLSFGTAEGESLIRHYAKGSKEHEMVTSTVKTLRNVDLKGTPEIDLTQQKSFSKMTKSQQSQWTKEMQNLGYESSPTGFRRFTGSVTGTYDRPSVDADIVLGARADASKIAEGIAERMGAGFTAREGQVYFKGIKIFEGLTPENAITRPLGYFGRFPQTGTISGVGTGTTQTITTKAGQSLTELGSAIRFPSGFTETGMSFGVDKTKRIADFAVTAGKLAEASGKSFNLGEFKSIYNAKYPDIPWSAGKITQPYAFTTPPPASSISSTAVSVFLPEGTSPTSANIGAFVPARSSTLSSSSSISSPSSISSISSISSPSVSSISSRSSSSSSSISSPSSISSISSISSPSVSSISSRSSSSSSSSVSSLSSSSSSISSLSIPALPFLGKVQTGGGEARRTRSTGILGTTKYNPSLGSILVRQPKKKVTKKEFIQMTKKKYKGLGLRPIIEVVKD